MNITICLQRIYPDWKGAVWDNSYEGIKPHELETRPIPSLAELQAVWPQIEAERIAAEQAEEAKKKLAEIDLASIRSIREYIAAKVDAPQYIKDYEAQAIVEREKLPLIINTE